jgi:hypothetical protein
MDTYPSGNPVLSLSTVSKPQPAFLATDGLSIFRSVDGGCSWITAYTFEADAYTAPLYLPPYQIEVLAGPMANPGIPASPTIYGFALPSGLSTAVDDAYLAMLVLKSTDGGASWTMINSPGGAGNVVGCNSSQPPAVSVAPSNSQVVYLECSTASVGSNSMALYRSDNGGQTWSALSPLPTVLSTLGSSSTHSIEVDPKAASNVWLVGAAVTAGRGTAPRIAVVHSTTGGASWVSSLLPDVASQSVESFGIDVARLPARTDLLVAVFSSNVAYTTKNGQWLKLSQPGTMGDPDVILGALWKRGTDALEVIHKIGVQCHATIRVDTYIHRRIARQVNLPLQQSGTVQGWETLNMAPPTLIGLADFVPRSYTACDGNGVDMPQPVLADKV